MTKLQSVRGEESKQAALFSVISPEQRVPAAHPLRALKRMLELALADMSELLDEMYSRKGRPSIPPEWLLKSMVLMALYSIRSERQFCEQLDYNLLYRWFLNMSADEPVFNPSTFSKNRERFLNHDVTRELFMRVTDQAREANLLSSEHFSVDGTLIQAWASNKSISPKDDDDDTEDTQGGSGGRNPSVDFRGEQRSNDTHASTTDPEAKLARKGKGKEVKLSFSGHALMENRNGLLVDFRIDSADGYAERINAISMAEDNLSGTKRITLGADRGYDDSSFVDACRVRNITPHVAQNVNRSGGSAIDGRTTRHDGYQLSQKIRKRIEEVFGWFKTVGGLARTRFKGKARTQMAGYMVATAYNLTRMCRLATGDP